MVGDELDAADPGQVVYARQQIGQQQRLGTRCIPVAVDRLAQQGDLDAAAVGQSPHFVEDFGRRAALGGSPHARHDTIGAELIAAEEDADHGLVRGGPGLGRPPGGERDEAFSDVGRPGAGPVEAHLQNRPAAVGHLPEQRRQSGQPARSDHQIDVPGAAEDLLTVFLGHTAQHADNLFPTAGPGGLQTAQGTIDLILGVLPHTTGVQQDDVGP